MDLRRFLSMGLARARTGAIQYWLRTLGLAVVAALGVWIYAGYVEAVYPIRDWLAWTVLLVVAYTAFLNLAWFAIGNLILRRLLRERELPLLESNVTSLAIGVVAFTCLMYGAGALGLYGPRFSLLLPTVLLAAGAYELPAAWRQYRSDTSERAPLTTGVMLLWAFGAALTAVLYLGLFSPDALNYDATWCHLTISQDYAREGGIVPFPADYSKTVPQLASLIHTWDYSVPGFTHPAQRWMLVLHQEFALLLWTLAGIAAAVRRMTDAPRAAGSWAAFYLFPMIFVYDHNLGGAADHVTAFFAMPAALGTARLLASMTWRRAVIPVICMAGGLLTKYQAFYWVTPLLAVIAFKVAWVAVSTYRSGTFRTHRAEILKVSATVPVLLGILIAPHFLKNYVFYGNPIYPFLQDVFPGSRPTVKDGVFLFKNTFTDLNWVFKGTLWEKLRQAAGLTQTFSFEPHYSFSKNFPSFGSLFTLLFPAALLLPRLRKKLLYLFVSIAAVMLWSFTFHIDRNLQILSPILIASTAAILFEVWRLGWAPRLAIAPLVAFQLIWGADAFFYSAQDRIRSAFDLIGSGYAGTASTRFDRYRSTYTTLGKSMPRDATVLFHSGHVTLGIDRRVYLDWAGFQGLISYSSVRSSREVHELYRGLGVTHVLYVPGLMPAASIQEEILFQTYARDMGAPLTAVGGHRLWRLPDEPPPIESPYRVMTIGLYGYGSGIFPIEQLWTNEHINPTKRVYRPAPWAAPTTAAELESANVHAIVVGAGATVDPAQSEFIARHFTSVISYPYQQTIYLRREEDGSRRR